MSAFRRFGGVIPLGLIAIGSTLLLAAVSSAARLPSPPPHAVTITAKYGGEITVDPTRFHVYDIPRIGFEQITGFSPDRQATEAPLGRQILAPAAATGRVLTILVEWENHPANPLLHPLEAYDSLLYSDHLYPTGSVRDYYQEVSYGSFVATGAVFGWVYLSSWYNGWYNINEIVEKAVAAGGAKVAAAAFAVLLLMEPTLRGEMYYVLDSTSIRLGTSITWAIGQPKVRRSGALLAVSTAEPRF